MKSVAVLVTASSDAPIVAAQGAGKVIRVLGLVISAKTALDGSLYSGSSASGTLLLTEYLPATTTVVMPPDKEGYFDTAANEALVFKGSTTGNTTVTVRYAVYPS